MNEQDPNALPITLKHRLHAAHQLIRMGKENIANALDAVRQWIDEAPTPTDRYLRQQSFGQTTTPAEAVVDVPIADAERQSKKNTPEK